MADILLLGDDYTTIELLCTLLCSEGYRVSKTVSLDQCWEALDAHHYRVLFMDLNQEQDVIADFAEDMLDKHPGMRLLIGLPRDTEASPRVRAYGDHVQTVNKPFRIDALMGTMQALFEQTEQIAGASGTRRVELHAFYECADLVARSGAMQKAVTLIERIAPTGLPVLLIGEPGTERELVARALQRRSPRAEGPFIEMDGRDLADPEVAERMLFGEPGSKKPPLKRATGGMLFIDGIEHLDPVSQRKLGEALAEDKGNRGGDRIRLVAGSAQSAEAVSEQLEPRLAGMLTGLTVLIPPLRERREDIMPLIAQVIQENGSYSVEHSAPELTEEAVHALETYTWPGNVAELVDVVTELVEDVEPTNPVITLDALPRKITTCSGTEESGG